MKTAVQFVRKKYYADHAIVPALRRAGRDKLADRIAGCGSLVLLAECKQCHTHNYAGNHSRCNSKYCPNCARSKANAWIIKIKDFMFRWLSDCDNYAFALNLTIKDTEKLSDGLNILQKAFRYLLHDNKKYRKIFRNLFVGGLRSIEVKTGKGSKLWHPHIHCIVLQSGYHKDFSILKDMWNEAVKVSGGQPAENGKYGSIYLHGFPAENIEKNVVEVCKYITKANWSKESPDRINELISCTQSLRSIQTWGILHGVHNHVDKIYNSFSDKVLENRACGKCGGTDFILEPTYYDNIFYKNATSLVYDDSVEAQELRKLYEASERIIDEELREEYEQMKMDIATYRREFDFDYDV